MKFVWSYSDSRSFERCARQWYFGEFVVQARSKDSVRREAYVLRKLDSLAAWRGKLVDTVLENELVPAFRRHQKLSLATLLDAAHRLFDEQIAFALQHQVRKPGLVISKERPRFAAWKNVEDGSPPSKAALSAVWDEVEAALRNLFGMGDLLERLAMADYVIAQRALMFQHDILLDVPISVRTVPDLIAFYKNAPPLIVDWKVHAQGKFSYRDQLALYAVALCRCKPHKDFPPDVSTYVPQDIALLEVQLLTCQQRAYNLTQQDIDRVDSTITDSAQRMALALESTRTLDPFAMPTAHYPETCSYCAFKPLCWKESACSSAKQMSLLF